MLNIATHFSLRDEEQQGYKVVKATSNWFVLSLFSVFFLFLFFFPPGLSLSP